MQDLADKEALASVLQEVNAALASNESVLIEGGTGSGRSLVAAHFRVRGDVVIEPPGLDDPDAPLHALLQAALDASSRDVAQQDHKPLVDRARAIADAIRATTKLVVLRVPASWRSPTGAERSADEMLRARRAKDVVDGLLGGIGVGRWVLIGQTGDTSRFEARRIGMPRMRVRLAAIDTSSFGSYARFADDVKRWCGERRAEPTPLQFRVAVALRALDAIGADAVGMLDARASLQLLEARLTKALRAHAHKRRAAFRAALARVAIPADALRKITKIADGDEALLTECLGYPTSDGIVMHERVRSAVFAACHDDDDVRESAHESLGRHHLKFDGVADPTEAPDVVQWLEATHHLANGGVGTHELWSGRTLRCRELYWDRGRGLSLGGHYREAAGVYATCLEQCGKDDSYAHHYLAFNLDKLGEQPKTVEQEFRAAIDIERDNPWWNSRYITHLVERSQFIAARKAFHDALEHVDPDGERVRERPWIARQFHRWVVDAWLRVGEVELAREAFDTIPPTVVEDEGELHGLAQRLADAEESRALGESVYPEDTPMEDRWREPRLVPATAGDSKRVAWYPGRVVDATSTSVMLVFAVPAEEPTARRTKLREMSHQEWIDASNGASSSGFVEIGSYANGAIIIMPIASPKPKFQGDDGELRWLKRWRTQS